MTLPSIALAGGTTRVKGYFKKDGTYVAPYYRTNPNSTKSDNWSTKGNYNPYTGEVGKIDPSIENKKSTQITPYAPSFSQSYTSGYPVNKNNTTYIWQNIPIGASREEVKRLYPDAKYFKSDLNLPDYQDEIAISLSERKIGFLTFIPYVYFYENKVTRFSLVENTSVEDDTFLQQLAFSMVARSISATYQQTPYYCGDKILTDLKVKVSCSWDLGYIDINASFNSVGSTAKEVLVVNYFTKRLENFNGF